MTKKELFDYFVFLSNKDKSYKYWCKSYFKQHYPDFYSEYLKFKFDDDLIDKPFKQKLWHFLQDDHGILGHCRLCGNRSYFMTFKTGYLKFCCNKCANNSPETKTKIKETVSKQTVEQKEKAKEKNRKTHEERYGGIGFASSEIKAKYENTMETSYGAKHNFLVQEIIDKRNETWCKNHNADNPMKNPKIALKSATSQKNRTPEQKAKSLEKSKNTRKQKYNNANYVNKTKAEQTCELIYGNKCAMKSGKCRDKLSNTLFDKTKKKYPFLLSYDRVNKIFTCECINQCCDKCKEKQFSISYKTFWYRITKQSELCTKTNPPYYRKHISDLETSVFEYIQTIYLGNILRNDRIILNGKELDIYLPDLKLAFEINGDFWHLNPELYDNNYKYKDRTVESEQNRRLEKTKLAKSKGITLIHIWQYDWNNKQEYIKNFVKTTIEKLS